MSSAEESGYSRGVAEHRSGLMTEGVTRWLIFSILSANFFMAVASTYGSLGVALPYMIEEMGWNWTSAGSGFTILALMSGIGSVVPAMIIQRFGARANYLCGGVVMGLGFILLATSRDLPSYFLGTFLAGLGFPLMAFIPSVQVLTEWIAERRSFAIGGLMMFGGLGGVAGPLVVTGIVESTDSWRVHWWLMATVLIGLGVLSALIVKPGPARNRVEQDGSDDAAAGSESASKVFVTKHSWPYWEALKTRQFALITLGLTMSTFCVVTCSTWAVAHLTNAGISTTMAAGSLSLAAAVNAASRLFGGFVASRIEPKWLLVSALLAEAAGMLALAIGDTPLAVLVFALGEGYGFGMSLFAATVMLVNYFGPMHNTRLMGALNLLTTVAMLGPILAGIVADNFGSIAMVLQAYAVLLLVILVAVAASGHPRQSGVGRA